MSETLTEVKSMVRDVENEGEEFTLDIRSKSGGETAIDLYAMESETGDIYHSSMTVRDVIDYVMENNTNED